ncbi:MAG TPA: biotin-dependent carboxyltransferase family protein [Vicinamibacterales bacterium]|nr:biotin-dependent carboxyltransferase family protein [Vicinamibacterales bacterium]
MGAIRIIRPGLLTTVQDLGRWGYQAQGVPVGGPMDPYAHRLANLILGNAETAATLEITLIGPELVFEQDARFVVAGADLSPRLGDRAVPMHTVCAAPAGAVLAFGARRGGARAYLAVPDGIQVPPVLGSRATQLVSAMGGVEGRALRAGDRLEIGTAGGAHAPPGRSRRAIVALPARGAVVRVLPGPQAGYFTDAAMATLGASRYTITTRSDRMGYRLDGPRLEHARGADIISDATPLGVLQVPASGQPILLMADRQTAGGYPKIATLITADLAIAGQLAPGDWIGFEICSPRQAVAALIERERPFVQG